MEPRKLNFDELQNIEGGGIRRWLCEKITYLSFNDVGSPLSTIAWWINQNLLHCENDREE